MALPARELPQAAAAPAASLDLRNSSLELAAWARWYVSPKTGAKIPREAVWVKMVPRAIAEGLTGGRSRTGLVGKYRLQVRLQLTVKGSHDEDGCCMKKNEEVGVL